MQTKLKLSALDADVLIDGDTVIITSSGDTITQIGIGEWNTLRESLRFDDVVDYEAGETPMTGYQLRTFIELFREVKNLEAENKNLSDVKKTLKQELSQLHCEG